MSGTNHHRILATARPLGEPPGGRRFRRSCSRCGRERQVNPGKIRHDDSLCMDCRSVDPLVWEPSKHAIWDPADERMEA